MTKERTVKKRSDFDRVINKGTRIPTASYRIFFLPNEVGHTRFGIGVGKKNGKMLVLRNLRDLLKRQVRAMVAKRNDYSLPLDVIILIRPSYSSEKFDENEAELLNALLELRINHIEN